jgi:hypothetical protein
MAGGGPLEDILGRVKLNVWRFKWAEELEGAKDRPRESKLRKRMRRDRSR